MKIKKELPQFEEERVLVIAAGRQTAEIYLAASGVITRAASLRIPAPRYSDREGFFITSGRGQTYRSGSVYEVKKEKVGEEFHRILRQELAKIARNSPVDGVYLFVPGYVKNEIRRALPLPLKDKVRAVFEGNHVKKHPSDLLGYLRKSQLK
jgi:hypothetical protein